MPEAQYAEVIEMIRKMWAKVSAKWRDSVLGRGGLGVFCGGPETKCKRFPVIRVRVERSSWSGGLSAVHYSNSGHDLCYLK